MVTVHCMIRPDLHLGRRGQCADLRFGYFAALGIQFLLQRLNLRKNRTDQAHSGEEVKGNGASGTWQRKWQQATWIVKVGRKMGALSRLFQEHALGLDGCTCSSELRHLWDQSSRKNKSV